MKLIKTRRQSVLYRVYEFHRGYYLVVSVMHFFPLDRPELLSETELWEVVSAEVDGDTPLDMGLPKAKAEVLAAAKCFAPGGKAITGGKVRLKYGPIDKTLFVFGDRSWQTGGLHGISDPEPFTVMDISHARAFGGPDFKNNPLGKGHGPSTTPAGQKFHPLPNIEHPAHLISKPEDMPEPAGFGPLDISWPQRAAKAGTYDQAWLKDYFPGPAPDMDPTIYNAAPVDQWLPDYQKGDEEFELEFMHPENSRQTGALPGFTPRIFLNLQTETGPVFKEVKHQLDTVWLFPHRERGLTIHRSMTEIKTDDAEDVLHLMVAYEAMSEPALTFEHYQREFVKRSNPKTRHFYLLNETGLAPESETARQIRDDHEAGREAVGQGLQAELAKKQARKQEEELRRTLTDLGLDPAEVMAPPEAIEPEINLDGDILDPEKLEQIIEQAKAAAEIEKKKAMETARQTFADLGLDYDQLNADPPVRAPRFSMAEIIAGFKEMGVNDPGFEEQLLEVEARIKPVMKQIAHQMPLPLPVDQTAVEEVMQRLKAGESLAGLDLAGIELCRHNLAQADLKEALLEGADLSEADLSGADLSGAILCGADLSGAKLHGARLTGANLGGANLTGARCNEARLGLAILEKADLTETDFTRAVMKQANLTGAVLNRTRFSGVDLGGVLFLENALPGVDFQGADLSKAVFMKTDLTRADFSAAKCVKTIFVQVKAVEAKFARADLTGVRMVNNCLLSGADFGQALMERANLMGADLTGAHLEKAQMNEAIFMKACLHQANLLGAVARLANFIKADLTGAVMVGMDLMEANLLKADLTGARLDRASLYSAELMRANITGASLDQADLTMTKLKPMELK